MMLISPRASCITAFWAGQRQVELLPCFCRKMRMSLSARSRRSSFQIIRTSASRACERSRRWTELVCSTCSRCKTAASPTMPCVLSSMHSGLRTVHAFNASAWATIRLATTASRRSSAPPPNSRRFASCSSATPRSATPELGARRRDRPGLLVRARASNLAREHERHAGGQAAPSGSDEPPARPPCLLVAARARALCTYTSIYVTARGASRG